MREAERPGLARSKVAVLCATLSNHITASFGSCQRRLGSSCNNFGAARFVLFIDVMVVVVVVSRSGETVLLVAWISFQ